MNPPPIPTDAHRLWVRRSGSKSTGGRGMRHRNAQGPGFCCGGGHSRRQAVPGAGPLSRIIDTGPISSSELPHPKGRGWRASMRTRYRGGSRSSYDPTGNVYLGSGGQDTGCREAPGIQTARTIRNTAGIPDTVQEGFILRGEGAEREDPGTTGAVMKAAPLRALTYTIILNIVLSLFRQPMEDHADVHPPASAG